MLIGTDNTARKQAEEALLKAGALQKAIFNSANFSSIATDAKGVIQIFNVGAERMLGYTAADVMNKITPADISDPQEVIARAKALSVELSTPITPGFEALVFKASRGVEDSYELTYIRKDGSRFPAVVSVTALRDAQNAIIGYLLIGTDNTARKQADARVRESEDRYRLLVEESPELIGIYQEDKLVFINSTGARLFGAKAKEELVGRKSEQVIHPDDLPDAMDRVRRRLAGETGRYPAEVRYVRLDGTTLPVEVSAAPTTFGGKPAVQFIARDITERKRAEAVLQEVSQEEIARQKLRTVKDLVLIFLLSASVFVVTWYFNLFHGPLHWIVQHEETTLDEQIMGVISLLLGFVWFGFRRWQDTQSQVTQQGRVQEALRKLHAEVETRAQQRTAELARTNEALRAEITERQQAVESQARLAMAVEHAAETIVITDDHGTILYANPAFEKITGYTREEAIGQNSRVFKSGKHDAAFYRRMWAVLTAGGVWSGQMINKRKDGTLYEEEATISPVRDAAGKIVNYVAVKRDVTEQKKLEAQMLRTQRLESIGTLASGVAHDLNNALAPIMMAAELLRLEFPDTASEYLDLIQAGAKHGADMVKQLLTFAKGVEGERLLLQPKHLLKEMEKLIQGTFPKNIELQTSYAKNLQTILGDATQLHQVLLNLCVNARDAMPEGGTLTLKAENIKIDTVYARTVPEAKPGHYVVWRVTDTGTGIPPEIMERIFEPFFSTKGPDKGTGLGLSTVIGIVKSHGGFVQVYSIPGQGSTFAVYLPAYGSDTGGTSLLTKTDTTFRGHGETILVVDDEAAVREMMRAVLTKLNFKVLTAADGTAALIQVSENRTELRVVITDLHMPHMDGLAFVRVLKGRLPQTGIIVTSGRLDEREANEFQKLGVNALLEKPFTQEKLVAALKTIFQN